MKGSRGQQRSPRIHLTVTGELEARVRSALGPAFEFERDPSAPCDLRLISGTPGTAPEACATHPFLDQHCPTPWIVLLPEAAPCTAARGYLQVGASDVIPLEILDESLEAAVRATLPDSPPQALTPEPRFSTTSNFDAQTRGLELALDTVREAYDQTLAALVAALDCREKETACHSQRVATYAIRIAIGLGLESVDLEDLYRGALLHDIGKIGMPDAILLKAGALTEAEWGLMREHPERGARLIERISFLGNARRILIGHHEAWDGTGYPAGLSGEEIPLEARIFAVADTYDAMRSERPYKPAEPHSTAIATIQEDAGSRLDPVVADWFSRQPASTWEPLGNAAQTHWTFQDALQACCRIEGP